jgi:tetratricopeptide (TPR) repeat protein
MSAPTYNAEYIICPYCRTPSPPGRGPLQCPSCGAPLPARPPRPPAPKVRAPRSGWPFAVFFLLPVGTLASGAFFLLTLAGFGCVTEAVENAHRYRTGVAAMEAGRYEEAAITFAALGNYKEAPVKYGEARDLAFDAVREEALTAELNGNFRGAAAACERARDYASTEEDIAEISLIAARNYFRDGDFWSAGKNFDTASTSLTLGEEDRALYDEVRRIRAEEAKWENVDLTEGASASQVL